ncbi:unnamed protein product [Meganyctiphanes norvegica]|uniref:GDT1 family protein n=1 Tax=Meganyctiphanes norvegica TaxID=48144 RepID=A0AAV2PNM8_MEGNR
MLNLRWLLLAAICTTSLALAEIQPVDVDPIAKKEQPDFEDDTGLGPGGAENNNNNEVDELLNKFNVNEEDEDHSFAHGFIASLGVIIVTELGDKTFFIAAIMAMNHPRLTVFTGAMLALAIMHVMSAMFGFVITVIPRLYTFYASSALFFIFGIRMIKEGYTMKPEEAKEEYEEVASDLRRREDDFSKEPLEEGGAGIIRGRGAGQRNKILRLVSRVFIQALTLTFLAEWGDRSQIATVVMATREDVKGIIVGGLIGHFLCTGLAVIGGRLIATRISVRSVTLIGGVVFILFGLSALIMGP